MGEKIIELIRESTVVQGTITIVVLLTVAYMAIMGQSVPDFLIQALMLVLGFYFGAKSQQQAMAIIRTVKEKGG